MIAGQCGPSGTFSLITWLLITQSGHDAYQIKAEVVSYRTVTFILLLIRNLKIWVAKNTQIIIFCRHFFEFV